MTIKKYTEKREYMLVKTPVKIECDFCHKSIKQYNPFQFAGGELNLAFGYGSKYDGAILRDVHMCDKCADKHLFKKVK